MQGEFDENNYHHLSIPEISNVNLYNQKPFLKKNSINTPDSVEGQSNTPENKKHFEYGTPLANDSHWTPGRAKGSFHNKRQDQMGEKNLSNKNLLTAYELNKLESKYQKVGFGHDAQKPISQFTIREGKAHQSLLDNRVNRGYLRKNSRGSRKQVKQRSKSKKNWSKQRIRRELEKFEEELQEEGKEQYGGPEKSKAGRLGQRKSKRTSVKAISNSSQRAPVSLGNTYNMARMKKKSRVSSSRNSNQMQKGHTKRVSSNMEDSEMDSAYQQKMVRSHVRKSYTTRNKDHEMSMQIPSREIEGFDNMGYTQRNQGLMEKRRRHQVRYMQSSRDIGHHPIHKRVRQSHEHNYVPEEMERHIEPWERPQRINRHNYAQQEPYKQRNQKMNFDYRNINANVYMKLPFE